MLKVAHKGKSKGSKRYVVVVEFKSLDVLVVVAQMKMFEESYG
jgi:hypothetical protein